MDKSKHKKSQTQDWQKQIDELTEALKRERADATNMRRRYDEHISSLQTVAKASVIRDLLPVIDNFERSLKHVPEELAGNDYIRGIQGVVKQFEKVLEQLGVSRIKTVGEVFNPHVHEAVSMEDGDGEQEIICEELQPGYMLGEEVLRHAMVRVRLQ